MTSDREFLYHRNCKCAGGTYVKYQQGASAEW